ncbi:ABC transporter ATP-binding protein [Lactobacillus sp. CC-MHH1034]|uniref:ABC transporter ATP-binding protein n=1 Tax=Agrilactobacillus fermenti TaxID=2586909 RepID=UPI001E367D31|nr:ABC transporter ATP-binding protein [Agrilactobacillus fermenti]MCD2257442.1 ABC transporter ATP-binding protein [Agrilactobacillus fermenti]
MDNTNIITITDLTRIFKNKTGWFSPTEEVTALNNVSLKIKRGTIFGLLGQNGAGKSTTIKILTTLLLPTSGNVLIDDLDVTKDYKEIRKKINFIFGGEQGVYKRLTPLDNLIYFGNLYKVNTHTLKKRIPELLNQVDLYDVKDRLVENFSKGMIERLQIAKGLINSPSILFMDEPTIGLDALSVRKIHGLIKNLNDHGTTIVLTTHYLKEVEELCSSVAIINKGNLVAKGTPDEIIEKYATKGNDLESAYISIIKGDS